MNRSENTASWWDRPLLPSLLLLVYSFQLGPNSLMLQIVIGSLPLCLILTTPHHPSSPLWERYTATGIHRRRRICLRVAAPRSGHALSYPIAAAVADHRETCRQVLPAAALVSSVKAPGRSPGRHFIRWVVEPEPVPALVDSAVTAVQQQRRR